MSKLSANDRETIRQMFLDGKSHATIARLTGQSYATVLHAASGMLSAKLDARYTQMQEHLATLPEGFQGWVAGVIDGEGTISVNFTYGRPSPRQRIRIHMSISNSDPKMIDALLSGCGGGDISQPRPRQPHHKQQHTWALRITPCVRAICEWLEPLLVTKRQHARLAAEFTRIRMANFQGPTTPREWEIANELRVLNGRRKAAYTPDAMPEKPYTPCKLDTT